jgi:hypothetical protein
MNRGQWLIQAMAVGCHGIIIFIILAFTKVVPHCFLL